VVVLRAGDAHATVAVIVVLRVKFKHMKKGATAAACLFSLAHTCPSLPPILWSTPQNTQCAALFHTFTAQTTPLNAAQTFSLLTRHHTGIRTLHATRHTSHVTRVHTSNVTLQRTSHVTHHTSHVTPYTSHLTPHTTHLTPHTSHLTPHTSSAWHAHVSRAKQFARSALGDAPPSLPSRVPVVLMLLLH